MLSYFFLEYFSWIAKFICLKLDTNEKKLHVQITQTSKVDGPYFLKCPSFLSNVYHSLLKLRKFLRLMIKRSKGLELIKIFFITSLNTFGLIMFLILQIMDFENVTLKFFFFFWWKAWIHIHNKYDINLICSQDIFISNM